jgi:hypothetical protein
MQHMSRQNAEKTLKEEINFEIRHETKQSVQQGREHSRKQAATQQESPVPTRPRTVGGFPLPFALVLGTIAAALLLLVARVIGIL